MATVDKNFKVKHGLVVEGTTATVNGDNIVTETAAQTLSSKEFNGETKFHAGNGAGTFKIDLNTSTGETTLTGNNSDLNIVTNGGDIVLNADGATFLGTNTIPGNEVATKSYVDGQVPDSTDGLTEGSTNKYYSTSAAKTDAAALLTGATLTNITITGNGSGLTITAENGVADSTTDDLEEGSTNLYFTSSRAVTANEGLWDVAGAASTAEGNANDYTDTAVANKVEINDSTAGTNTTWSGYKINSEISGAVSNLVDSAPALLDTLNELAAAIADNPNYATDMATSLSEKQNTLTEGTGINIVSDTISVDETVIASVDYVDTNFVNVADLPGQLGDYIPLTQKDAANGVATLDSTGNVPAGQLGNVPANYITSVGNNLDVTAGQLTVSNTPVFTSVQLGWYATEVQGYASGNATTTLYPISLGNGASAKLVVRAMSNSTGHSQMSEILVTKDSNNNVAITEYAIVGTNGSLGDVSAEWDAVDGIKISFTPTENGTEVMVSGTSYVWND